MDDIAADLINYDKVIWDEDKIIYLMNSLPLDYEHLVLVILHGKSKLDYEEVATALQSEELRKMDSKRVSRLKWWCVDVEGKSERPKY